MLALVFSLLGGVCSYAAPAPQSSPPPPCTCQPGYYFYRDKGLCYRVECVSKDIRCSSVGKSYSITGMPGKSEIVPCNDVPPNAKPPSWTSPGIVGGGTPGTAPTKQPTATPKPKCPSLIEYGDGGDIGQCMDGDASPISEPTPDYLIPGLLPIDVSAGYCIQFYKICYLGCWIYDYDWISPIFVDPALCFDDDFYGY
jgi:hypothetical protein